MFIRVVNYVANFPLPKHRTLPHFAAIIGFPNCEDQYVKCTLSTIYQS